MRGLVGGALAIGGATLQGGYDAAKGGSISACCRSISPPRGFSLNGTISGVGGDLLSGIMPQAFDADLTLFGPSACSWPIFPISGPRAPRSSTRDWVTQHIPEGCRRARRAARRACRSVAGGGQARRDPAIRRDDEIHRPLGRILPPLATGQECHRHGQLRSHRDRVQGWGSADVGNIHATAATARFYQLDTHDEQPRSPCRRKARSPTR